MRSRFGALPCLPADSPDDFDAAATIHRACRARGETVRSLTDCLIAGVAIRADGPVRHSHRDFEVIARHTALQVLL
jgi:predicted nucleic acid-binding protein